SDHSRIYISDVIAVEDKYPERHLKIEKSSKKKKGGKKVESSFDLALFGDLSSEVDRKRVGALRWATSTEGVIDNILTTENMRVSRMKTDVSNTVALFTYKLSTTIDLSSVDKYNELIDNVLGLSGSDVSVREGKILVSVPLPDKHRAPIDIAQMYREAFFIKS
ncbi:hypothetical protein, partial [Corynebacterium mastitidis]|uniref:hypothetical protein n=1 Tax=Corynebacterium mastitidis TaxID=161890 RepID=UPI001B7FC959